MLNDYQLYYTTNYTAVKSFFTKGCICNNSCVCVCVCVRTVNIYLPALIDDKFL